MNILNVSAECFPVAKVGGLADVVGALPKYQNDMGVSSMVIMPYYANTFTIENKFDTLYESKVKLDELIYNFKILKTKLNLGFPLYLVKIPGLLDREGVYSDEDDTERFLAFQIAVLDWVLSGNIKPSIIHCHDHHTGFIPFMLSHAKKYISLKDIPSILTIHNAQYQGQFSYDKLRYFPEFDQSKIGFLDWDGQINPLAAAVKCAWRVTTVSPGYMKELKINANGLEALISDESAKCSGILNGIDTDVWNPETDDYIINKYSEKTIQL